jgi:hypothetical protein
LFSLYFIVLLPLKLKEHFVAFPPGTSNAPKNCSINRPSTSNDAAKFLFGREGAQFSMIYSNFRNKQFPLCHKRRKKELIRRKRQDQKKKKKKKKKKRRIDKKEKTGPKKEKEKEKEKKRLY